MLLCDSGGTKVDREQVTAIKMPEGTRTWKPIANDVVIDAVHNTLQHNNIEVMDEEYALSNDKMQMFAIWTVGTDMLPGFGDGSNTGAFCCVGFRNSWDKSLGIRFAIGMKVVVCDNLALSSMDRFENAEGVSIRHRNTVEDRLFEHLNSNVVNDIQTRIEWQQNFAKGLLEKEVTPNDGDAFIVNFARKGKDSLPWQMANHAVQEWHEPSHECYQDRNAWSLYNAITETLKKCKNFQDHTTRLLNLTDFTTKWFEIAA